MLTRAVSGCFDYACPGCTACVVSRTSREPGALGIAGVLGSQSCTIAKEAALAIALEKVDLRIKVADFIQGITKAVVRNASPLSCVCAVVSQVPLREESPHA